MAPQQLNAFLEHWNKFALWIKKKIPSSTKKIVQDEEGSVWEVSLDTKTIEQKKREALKLDATLFPTSPTLTFVLQVPKLSDQDTYLALNAYLEDHMGQEAGLNASLVFMDQNNTQRRERRVTAVLAQKKSIDSWLETRREGSPSLWFFPKPLALQRFFELYMPKELTAYVLDLAPKEITLLHIQEGCLVACRSLPIGTEIPLAQSIQQIQAALLAWEPHPSDKSPSILLTGPLSQEAPWKDQLRLSLSRPFYEADLVVQPLLSKASLFGAAHLAQPSLVGPLPPSFFSSYKTPYRAAWQTTLITAIALSLSLSFLFYWKEHQKETLLKNNMEQEFALLAKESWADSIKSCLPKTVDSCSEAEEALDSVQETMKKQSLFPLKPALPQVREALAWIADQIHTLSPSNEVITIQRLSYAFLQYPTIEQPQKRYQLKIDMEFTTNNAQIARAFHDRLLAQNDMIDHKTEVQWTVSQGGLYKTVFFIKDKTNYNSLM